MVEELLKYQETDSRLRKIEIELSGSEERKKAVSAKKYIESVEETVAKLDLKAQELTISYESAIAELEQLKSQESEFNKALDGVCDEMSATYLIKKTDEILNKIKNIYAKINGVNAEIQSILTEYASVKAKTKAAQAQYAEYGKKYNDLKASKKEEREKIEAELDALKKNVEPSLMERYLKKRSEKIFPILYEINGNVCGACNMELSMAEVNRLKNGEIIECEQCRRLLYKKS